MIGAHHKIERLGEGLNAPDPLLLDVVVRRLQAQVEGSIELELTDLTARVKQYADLSLALRA